jgi:hypothetical protein
LARSRFSQARPDCQMIANPGQQRLVTPHHDRRYQMTHLSNGTELLWGDRPAAMIEENLQRLIARLYGELHRHPTVAEIEEHIYGATMAREIVEGMANAAKVFREDTGRDPTCAELQAGLLLADTQRALLTYLELEIQVGDRVMWAECDANGERVHQTLDGRDMIVPAYGTVTAQPEGWHGDNTITREDGGTVIIGRKWLIRCQIEGNSDPVCETRKSDPATSSHLMPRSSPPSVPNV